MIFRLFYVFFNTKTLVWHTLPC